MTRRTIRTITGADHRFLFVSDHGGDDCAPSDCSHAIAQLQNIADNLGV